MWFVLGLGNPGRRYAATRHNLGFMVVETLLQRFGRSWQSGPGPCASAEIEIGAARALLVRPNTYVNLTGAVLPPLIAERKLLPERLLAVVDDVHLEFGRLRLRPSGSAGGHNGLQSLEDHLQSSAYPRLRLGIGLPAAGQELTDHVLGEFSEEERTALPDLLANAADAVQWILTEGIEASRAKINASPPTA